jgi:pSer/pThr/pTyr-binding forkhead associated (FHA) protein
MSGVLGEPCNELEFLYESDASSSFLVIRCEDKIIEYQVRMLENNDIKYIVPVEVIKKEGVNHYFYNITSKISLSLYVKRHKLNVEEFLKLLLGISASISDSACYLLTPSNFVLNAEYVYIDPETLDAMLVYIPAAISGDTACTLQSFVLELLMQHIHEEGFGSGNIVQRILSEVKSEMFNIKTFITLLNGLLYVREEKAPQKFGSEQNYCNKILENYDRNDKIEEKHTKKEKTVGKHIISPVIPAVILQFLMGGIVYMCRGLLYSAGKNPAVTFAAVILIVLSVEVLIFRKLQALKLFSIRSIDKNKDNSITDVTDVNLGQKVCNENAVLPVANKGNSVLHRLLERENGWTVKRLSKRGGYDLNGDSTVERRKSSINRQCGEDIVCFENAANVMETRMEAIYDYKPIENSLVNQKTEQLGKMPNGICMLRHADKLSGEKDIVIDKDEFIIGRLSGHVDHVLHNNAVGKLHAEFIRRNGSCYIKDLNSINGTYINSQRIESNKEIELNDNDKILLANCEFIYIAGHV